MDTKLLLELYGAHGTPALAALMIALTMVGSGWSMLGLGALLFVPRARALAWPLLYALVTTAIVVYVAKLGIGRVRPCWTVPGVHALFFPAPTDGSLPSGHAAGSFCVALYGAARAWTAKVRARLWIALGLVLVATGVAVSRVYLGVHYPLDVAAGALVGGVIGAAFALRDRAGSIQTAPAG